tara:strand:+ start:68 stop:433 length:366 start_codon:yes stop_codon:yes gene_type:complete
MTITTDYDTFAARYHDWYECVSYSFDVRNRQGQTRYLGDDLDVATEWSRNLNRPVMVYEVDSDGRANYDNWHLFTHQDRDDYLASLAVDDLTEDDIGPNGVGFLEWMDFDGAPSSAPSSPR